MVDGPQIKYDRCGQMVTNIEFVRMSRIINFFIYFSVVTWNLTLWLQESTLSHFVNSVKGMIGLYVFNSSYVVLEIPC